MARVPPSGSPPQPPIEGGLLALRMPDRVPGPVVFVAPLNPRCLFAVRLAVVSNRVVLLLLIAGRCVLRPIVVEDRLRRELRMR
jgi:hypothetical protein